MFEAYYKSPIGKIRIRANESYITEVLFTDDFYKMDLIPHHVQNCINQLDEYFNGKRQKFTIEINPSGTEFQGRVWNELTRIPYGKTISYIELAKKLGDEKAIRAVGTANGKNPIAIIIPCHRVIGADGSLVGYAGGKAIKEKLLHLEGALNPELFD